MPGAAKAEHVCLHVDDIAQAADFYGHVFGLAEISRRDGVIYYGCGLDENFDLAIQEGETGVEHVAVRVAEEHLIDEYEQRVEDAGVNQTLYCRIIGGKFRFYPLLTVPSEVVSLTGRREN